jgi:hypothetical protein
MFFEIRKASSALNSPDKHKPRQTRRLPFAFLSGVAYDQGIIELYYSIEGLGAGAGQFSKPQKFIHSYFIIKNSISQ